MKDNIAIIGFMGSGKTTVGEILAERLEYRFFDLDRLIEVSEGRSIKDIFTEDGEEYFRNIESKIIRKIIKNNNCVFACGGGAILRRENMRMIASRSDVVYLMISPSEAVKRLSGSTERPLISIEERNKKISELLNKRSSLYLKYAEIIINNEKLTPEEAADTIIKRIEDKDNSR